MKIFRTKHLWQIVGMVLFCVSGFGELLAQTGNRSLKTGIYPVVDKSGVKVDVGMDYEEGYGEKIFVDTSAVVTAKEMEGVEVSIGKSQYSFVIWLKPSGVSRIRKWVKEKKKENFILLLDGETYYLTGIGKIIDRDYVVVNSSEKFQLDGVSNISHRLTEEISPDVWREGLTYKIQRLDKALVQKDSIALKEILSDNLVFGHSNALKETKKDLIDHLYSGYLNYSNITAGSVEIHFSGDVVVVTRDINVTGVLQGNNFDVKLNVMETWILESEWKLLCRQSVKRQ